MPDAATAVAGVPTNFAYTMLHAATSTSNQTWNFNNLSRRYSVSAAEGINGLPFATANDPRIGICQGGDVACRAIGVTINSRDDLLRPIYAQTSAYGHFGRELDDFTWERTDRAEALRAAVGS